MNPNSRASAFQELCHPESTNLEKAPTAQLTRIDAADRLFSVVLTHITSVPECAAMSGTFALMSRSFTRPLLFPLLLVRVNCRQSWRW